MRVRKCLLDKYQWSVANKIIMHVSSYTNAVIIDTRCGFVNIVFLNILIDKAVIFIILHKFSVMLRKTCEGTEFIVLFLHFIHQLYVGRSGIF